MVNMKKKKNRIRVLRALYLKEDDPNDLTITGRR